MCVCVYVYAFMLICKNLQDFAAPLSKTVAKMVSLKKTKNDAASSYKVG